MNQGAEGQAVLPASPADEQREATCQFKHANFTHRRSCWSHEVEAQHIDIDLVRPNEMETLFWNAC